MSGGGIYTFDYPAWASLFPELAVNVNIAQANLYFGQACLFVDNTACSPIPDLTARGAILNLTTAHVAQLLAVQNGQPPSPIVGRISNASEGSVSVAAELNVPMSAAWWSQTRYGLMAWQAMVPYRTALYIPSPTLIPLAQQSYPGQIGGGQMWWLR